MTNYIAMVPKSKRQPVTIQRMSPGQEDIFWEYYEGILGHSMDEVLKGKLSVVPFSAETDADAIIRITDDFSIKWRRINVFSVGVSPEVAEYYREMIELQNSRYEDPDDDDSDYDDEPTKPNGDVEERLEATAPLEKVPGEIEKDFPYTDAEVFGAK